MNERPPVPIGPIVALGCRVAPERREELLSFFAEAFPVYERPGGIRMGLYESADEPGLFLELVAYESEAAYAADQARVAGDPELRTLLARWRSILAAPPEVRRMLPVRVGG
jgi:quinol monooxygenase YgiN